jgi:hypothetical protein
VLLTSETYRYDPVVLQIKHDGVDEDPVAALVSISLPIRPAGGGGDARGGGRPPVRRGRRIRDELKELRTDLNAIRA